MPRGFLVFLAVALAILLGFQYFIYFSTTRLLGINGRAGRRILAAALLFLMAGAVASVFLQRRVDSDLARAVAGTFQLYLGFGLTLAMAFLIAWAFWGTGRLWNPRFDSAPFGWSALVLAFLFSAFGVWSATHPRVARVTVHMRDLPAEWRGKTIAQISDLHLGFSVGRSFAERIVERR
jgi:cytochrome bd-type quinol oxidase subunit 2